MQGKQTNQGQGRDSRLVRMVKGQGRFMKLADIVFITFMITIMGCSTMQAKDEIRNLSFSADGKKVLFDRCRGDGCQIQVYDLETGELAAYQSPAKERWTMGRYAYDGRRITFSVIPIKSGGDLDLGDMQIAVMDAGGKNYRKVTTGPGAKLYPTFSHNGKKILYACAASIRKSGGSPAMDYDAWEVNLETGSQTQLSFFKYFYMNSLTYFPDDERFIFYGDRPCFYEGLRCYPDEDTFRRKMADLRSQGITIGGVVVMKGREVIPNPYVFPPKLSPQKPLLSKDGSVLIYGEYPSGKFYLYSSGGNHRFVGGGGSVNSAAMSPDGKLLAITYGNTINMYRVEDGKLKEQFFNHAATYSENWENDIQKYPRKQKMIPDGPSIIIGR